MGQRIFNLAPLGGLADQIDPDLLCGPAGCCGWAAHTPSHEPGIYDLVTGKVGVLVDPAVLVHDEVVLLEIDRPLVAEAS